MEADVRRDQMKMEEDSCQASRASGARVGAYLKWRMRRRLGDALNREEWGLSRNLAGSGSSFRDDERAGDVGVEGGKLESVLFREGEKVGVGGVFVISAPGGKVSAGGGIVGEEAVAVVLLGEKVIQATNTLTSKR